MATFAKDYWQLMFDADGRTNEEDKKSLIAEIKASGTSDVFLMSHGWPLRRRTPRICTPPCSR